jgi:hypothetical protein
MNSDEKDSQFKYWEKSNIDVLAEMKGHKFYLVPEEYLEEDVNYTSIILTDVTYWNNNFDELNRWCIINSVDIVGLSLKIYDPKIVMAFILKWS